MRINELLSTQQEIDEGVWDQVKGAAKGAWDGMKQGWSAAKTPPAAAGAATAPAASTTAAAPSGSTRPYVAPAASTTAAAPAATNAAPAPTASAPAATGDIGSIMQAIDKLDKPAKQQLAGELEKSINAPAGGDDYSPQELETMNKQIAAMDDARLSQVAARTNLDPTVTAAVKAEVEKRKSGQQATTPTDQAQTQQKSANGTAPAGTPPPAPGIAPAAADPATQGTEPAPTPGAGAFGQMAGQLKAMAPPEQSSTGGTTQQTATGQVHTASPTNPNRAAPAAPPAAPVASPVVPAGRTQGGGKVAGQLSKDPRAVARRTARAAARTATPTAEGFRSNFLGRML